MFLRRRLLRLLSFAMVLTAPALPAPAKLSTWQDVKGGSFRGEPTDILGPFVVFRTGGNNGRRVLLRAFSPEDCRRIHAEIATLPPRAASLAAAKGGATGDLPGKVLRLKGRELLPAELADQPEPEMLLLLCGSHNSGEGWYMMRNLEPFYRRVQRVYPGLLEGVFLGVRHDASQHKNIATQSSTPWLVADFRQQAAMPDLIRFLPREGGSNVVLVSRQGVPLVAAQAADLESVEAFFDQAAELLWQVDPANPIGWPDRLHYLNATRPLEYAQSRAEPLLVGNPLRADGLRKYGVKRVAARLAVAADGKVTPTVLSGPADLPAELLAPLASALAQAVVAPALDHGQPVASTLDYLLEVPPADPLREAERVWLSSTHFPARTIEEWLVLRPIKVEEQEFESSIIGETASGAVIFNALEVNSGKISRAAQMSAFNSDWFAAAGADSVRPKAGDRQKIDQDTELTWEKVRSKNGFVEMQGALPKDYVVGYAWAEFAVPAATDAWLGLGSDDGVKIWLNGELVHDKWIRRPSRVDDEVVPLHLKLGANRILIKIQNATIDWSFVYRLRLKP